MTDEPKRSWEQLTPDVMEAFLSDCLNRGLSSASLEAYRRNLLKLYNFLPEDKHITAGTAPEWAAWMEAQGVAPRSVNSRISLLNSISDYMGRRDFQFYGFGEIPEVVQPELTRVEYIRLLQTAKILNKEREYLLVKVMGGAGFRIQELPQLTVEAVKGGAAELSYHNGHCQRTARIPRGLREELLGYARRRGAARGPVFQGDSGKPISRKHVYTLLQTLAGEARVDEEKVTPRCLWNMYLSTRDTIFSSFSALAEQSYQRMLEEEDRVSGWGK